MKKVLVASILGLATVASTFAQGRVNLDTYNTAPYPKVTYGANNVNGSSGGVVGSGVNSTFTIGMYWAVGTVSVAADASGYASISSIAPSLTLATGTGATAVANTGGAGPGWFSSASDYTFTGVASGQVTLVIVAYNGATYDTSTVRGHSAGFQITPAQGIATAPGVGSVMPQFSVFNAVAVPEPSTFALAGLGLAGLLIFRRRK